MGKIVFMHCDLDSSDGRTVEGITLVVDGDSAVFSLAKRFLPDD